MIHMMKRDFYAYREQNMVIPPLDFIRYPDGNNKIIGAPPCILSQWAINSKPAGDLNSIKKHRRRNACCISACGAMSICSLQYEWFSGSNDNDSVRIYYMFFELGGIAVKRIEIRCIDSSPMNTYQF